MKEESSFGETSEQDFKKEYMGNFVRPDNDVYWAWLEYYRRSEALDRCYPGYWSKHGIYIPFPNKKLAEERSLISPPAIGGDRKFWLQMRDFALEDHEQELKRDSTRNSNQD